MKSKKSSVTRKTSRQKNRVLGFGYIGLPTALLLAQEYPVIGVDIHEKIIKTLNNGNLPFKEKGLDTLFQKVRGILKAITTVEQSDTFIIVVRPSISVGLK